MINEAVNNTNNAGDAVLTTEQVAAQSLKNLIASMANSRISSKAYANRVARVLRMSRHNNTPLAILFVEHERAAQETARLADDLDALQVLERRLKERLFYAERRILRAERHLWYTHNAVNRAGHRDEEAIRAYNRAGHVVAREFERQKLTVVEMEMTRKRIEQVTEALEENRARQRGLADDMDAWLDEREMQLDDGTAYDRDAVNELAFVESAIEQMVASSS